MNKFQTFFVLRHHVKLAESRSVFYEANKVAQVLTMIGISMLAVYVVFFAVLLSIVANNINQFTPCQFFFGLLPFILPLDFLVRFAVQHTPAQMVRQYLILPLRKYDCVDSFILSSIITPNNFMWLFLTVPYSIMSIAFSTGLIAALSFIIAFQIIVVINSLFYMMIRTLTNEKVWYIFIPVLVYALLFIPWYFSDFDGLIHYYSNIGEYVSITSPLFFIVLSSVVTILFFVNRIIQHKFIIAETMTEKDIKLKSISSFSFLDRFTQTGEYLKLEVKSMLRNKNLRQTFSFSLFFVLVISLIDSFTDVYDDGFSTCFWAVYPFTLLSINLVRIMCPEGNFIECLLVHKENIRCLLEAKYYFYLALLIPPFVLMLPTVFSRKYSLLMLVSMMFFTAGPMFCLLMQLAVVNKVTMPLNTKLTRRNGLETNYIQIIIEMVALFFPVALISFLSASFGETIAYLIMLFIGILFICFHRFWINSIYRRMMKRKYKNIEGFMTSR